MIEDGDDSTRLVLAGEKARKALNRLPEGMVNTLQTVENISSPSLLPHGTSPGGRTFTQALLFLINELFFLTFMTFLRLDGHGGDRARFQTF